jgi:hypothetical protein
MPEQLANDFSTPQTEAQTTPPMLPRGDSSYFTQEMANVNAAITEMRLQILTNESAVQKNIDNALNTFAKTHLELKADSRVLSAEVKGGFKALEESIKYLTTSVAELKPKVDNLTNWGRVVIGISIAVSAGVALYKSGVIKVLL